MYEFTHVCGHCGQEMHTEFDVNGKPRVYNDREGVGMCVEISGQKVPILLIHKGCKGIPALGGVAVLRSFKEVIK